MGEIADMMLDGTMCECCGEFLNDGADGPGYPVRCFSCREPEEKEKPKKSRKKPKDGTHIIHEGQPIGKKMVNRLQDLAMHGTEDGPMTPKQGQRMYAGEAWKFAPTQYEKLAKRGFVERRSPHNPAHDDRAVITPAGLKFLEEMKAKT